MNGCSGVTKYIQYGSVTVPLANQCKLNIDTRILPVSPRHSSLRIPCHSNSNHHTLQHQDRIEDYLCKCHLRHSSPRNIDVALQWGVALLMTKTKTTRRAVVCGRPNRRRNFPLAHHRAARHSSSRCTYRMHPLRCWSNLPERSPR